MLTKNWAKSLLRCLGYVKRRASSKANISISEFEAHKDQFAFDVKSIIEIEEIPKELVINWDNWTMAKEGSKRIEIVGAEDNNSCLCQYHGRRFSLSTGHLFREDVEESSYCTIS